MSEAYILRLEKDIRMASNLSPITEEARETVRNYLQERISKWERATGKTWESWKSPTPPVEPQKEDV